MIFLHQIFANSFSKGLVMALRQMRILHQFGYIFTALLISLTLLPHKSHAAGKKSGNSALPSVLKADQVDGDQLNNTLTATGNVEVSKGDSVVYSDQVFYEKNKGVVHAVGNVRIKNIEIGNVKAENADIKDDFSSGKFSKSTMVLLDGSYLTSPEIDRKTPEITNLTKSIYSICPNPEISQDNNLAGKKRDMLSIKSRDTTIDRGNQVFKIKGGVVRFYDVPFFYTPFLQAPLPSKKRQSGFLYPSYTKSTRMGLGFKTPYYVNISPDKELTVTPHIHPNTDQILLNNEFHQLAAYGEYRAALEVANNKISPSTNVTTRKEVKDPYRWHLSGNGIFDFTKNTGLDYTINTTSDKGYLRDYYNDFRSYNLSKVNVDYINGRQYHAAKMVRIQEYENIGLEKSDPLILPIIDSHIETKPFFYKEKFALTSNTTVIDRDGGLQYRRITTIPEVNLPINMKGNLFNLNAKVQGDLYSLENNFQNSTPTARYDSVQTNYKPEFSASWRMPLIKKMKSNTIMIEPMINFVSSSNGKNFNKLPNEDSNNNELTITNLFVSDRISGFDRNESGERVSYGAKSSLFNSYGEFGLVLGQSFKKSDNTQDVTIRGFNNNNKSNIVGMTSYKASKYFYTAYSFHLNESDYRNEINELMTTVSLERFTFGSNFLFLRRNSQNSQEIKQLNVTSMVKVSEKFSTGLLLSRNMITGRNLNRSLSLLYGGCCTIFGFSVTESNPSNLVGAQRSFNISLSFKNL